MSVVGLCPHALERLPGHRLPRKSASASLVGIPPLILPVVLGASAPQGRRSCTLPVLRRPLTAPDGRQAAVPVPASADWIARQVDHTPHRPRPRLTIRMRLFDRQGVLVSGRWRERPARAGRRRRSRAGRVHHPHHIAGTSSWLGNARAARTTRASLPAGPGAGPPHHRGRAPGELRRQRLHLRGHPPGRTLEDDTYALVDAEPAAGPTPLVPMIPHGAWNRGQGRRRALPEGHHRPPQGQLRGRRRRGLQPARRAGQGLPLRSCRRSKASGR